ncbi:Anoctamin-7, partial [Clydaea vesicula]
EEEDEEEEEEFNEDEQNDDFNGSGQQNNLQQSFLNSKEDSLIISKKESLVSIKKPVEKELKQDDLKMESNLKRKSSKKKKHRRDFIQQDEEEEVTKSRSHRRHQHHQHHHKKPLTKHQSRSGSETEIEKNKQQGGFKKQEKIYLSNSSTGNGVKKVQEWIQSNENFINANADGNVYDNHDHNAENAEKSNFEFVSNTGIFNNSGKDQPVNDNHNSLQHSLNQLNQCGNQGLNDKENGQQFNKTNIHQENNNNNHIENKNKNDIENNNNNDIGSYPNVNGSAENELFYEQEDHQDLGESKNIGNLIDGSEQEDIVDDHHAKDRKLVLSKDAHKNFQQPSPSQRLLPPISALKLNLPKDAIDYSNRSRSRQEEESRNDRRKSYKGVSLASITQQQPWGTSLKNVPKKNNNGGSVRNSASLHEDNYHANNSINQQKSFLDEDGNDNEIRRNLNYNLQKDVLEQGNWNDDECNGILKNEVTRRSIGSRHFVLWYAEDVELFDNILLWKNENSKASVEAALSKFGNISSFLLELEVSMENPNNVFIKILSPFHLLCKTAHAEKLRLPLKKQNLPISTTIINKLAPSSFAKFFNVEEFVDLNQQTGQFSIENFQQFKGVEPNTPVGIIQKNFFKPFHRSLLTRKAIEAIKIKIVGRPIAQYLGITYFLSENIYTKFYYPHDQFRDVETLRGISLREHLKKEWLSKCTLHQPLDHIRDYFGEKLTFYFAFGSYYTCWLIIYAIFGLIVTFYGIYDIRNNGAEDKWAWRRLYDNKLMPYFSFFTSFWVVVFLEFWKRKTNYLAFEWGLSNFENEESIRANFTPTTNKMGVSFFNIYARLFYYTFSKPFFLNLNDYGCLVNCTTEVLAQVGGVFLGDIVFGVISEIIAPLLSKNREDSKANKNIIFPHPNTLSPYGVSASTSSLLTNGDQKNSTILPLTSPHVVDNNLPEITDELELDYLQKITQYSILVMFSVIFPPAPFIAFIGQCFQNRSDGYKYLFLYKRIQPSQAQDIGRWYEILSFISVLAVTVNVLLVVYLSNSFEETYLTRYENSNWPSIRLGIVIVWHIAIYIFKYLISFCIPDIPKMVKIAKAREAYLEKIVILGDNEYDEEE